MKLKTLLNKKYITFKKQSIIILNVFTIFLSIIINKKGKLNKICLCAVAKGENKYIREFIEHYRNYGIDKIYIFDNNDKNGEKFEDVIDDYIKVGFVELIDYKDIKNPQIQSYNDCYKRYNKLYDWLIYFDIDEFIYLKDFTSFKSFLNDKRFDKCNRVQFNWLFLTDNNLLYYEDKPLMKRFREKDPRIKGKKFIGEVGIKSVIRGNIKNFKITSAHILNRHTRSCDGFGNRKKVKNVITTEPDFDFYYIKHYYCKSTEEFINNKLKKSDVFFKNDVNMLKIKVYFGYNKITKEKLDFIEKETKYNLTMFRNKIKI